MFRLLAWVAGVLFHGLSMPTVPMPRDTSGEQAADISASPTGTIGIAFTVLERSAKRLVRSSTHPVQCRIRGLTPFATSRLPLQIIEAYHRPPACPSQTQSIPATTACLTAPHHCLYTFPANATSPRRPCQVAAVFLHQLTKVPV